MDINKVVAVYVKMRDEKARIKKEADARCAEIQSQMDRLNAEILKYLQSVNSNLARTNSGTAYIKEVVKPSVKDWDAYDAWLVEHTVSPCDAYEKKVSRKFVKTYMAANNGALPAGVHVHREFAAAITPPPGSKSMELEQ